MNKSLMQKYMDAYLQYEKEEGVGVNPRESVEGTILCMRERYKDGIYQAARTKLDKGAPYLPAILELIQPQNENLVHYNQIILFENRVKELGNEKVEEILRRLYSGEVNKDIFDEVNFLCKNRFDLVGYLFFLKDKTKFLPIRSTKFEEKLKLIGYDLKLAGNCTWESYNEFLGVIREIRIELMSYINPDFTFVDAHSFVWMLDTIDEYISGAVIEATEKKGGSSVVRVGQRQYREAVKEVWGEESSVTGSSILYSAAHIKPWCVSSDKERLDRYNGLLLTPTLHEAFDEGLISFNDDGTILVSEKLSEKDMQALGINKDMKLRKPVNKQAGYLAYHRDNIFKK